MKRLEKIFNDINIQLKEEKLKYRKLKICKYSFEKVYFIHIGLVILNSSIVIYPSGSPLLWAFFHDLLGFFSYYLMTVPLLRSPRTSKLLALNTLT